ncbi:MAG TPA: hypothetical protein VG097_08555 [Gemmata sp.]|nr:hypothetical protein [Gemmata sp.]
MPVELKTQPSTLNAIFDKSPIPLGTGREDTGTYQPTIDHVTGSVHEKYPEPAGCPNFALCLTGEGGDRVPTGRCRLERGMGIACTIRSPTDPLGEPSASQFEDGVYARP